MKNIVLFRLEDDESIYLADLDSGTVEKTDASAFASEDVTASRGTPFVKGLDFALAARSRSEAPSHQLFPNR